MPDEHEAAGHGYGHGLHNGVRYWVYEPRQL